MKNAKKIIEIADKTVNWLIVICFLPLLLYGIYGIWDSNCINQQADASNYETYKPTAENDMSFAELQKKNPENRVLKSKTPQKKWILREIMNFVL